MSSIGTDLVVILMVFLGGVALGIFVIVTVAINREDVRFSLTSAAPGAATRGARVLMGFSRARP